ncbi:MAG: sn-glycerol-3-phosphate ABC transporter ATP-binding protein UgpC [Betaproteobacteria bacterium]|nr:sn-glycerol-3-phosphate ABC transporter ATP-binding protein UgpC [Betaproteobacteria bacterium]
MARVTLRRVFKRFGQTEVVHNLDLDIADEEFVAIVGPSGCGKSTVLKMIAGLEEVSAGEILIDDQVVNDLPPRERDIAMVFQDYALYPHMTVFDNMSFGLRVRKYPPAEIRERVERAAAILDLSDLLDRRPRQLSGGQRQRVAMGRAVVRDPRVFLFDEPLSNLDATLRAQMRTEIKKLRQKVRTTTVYVTHDQVEAMTLADRVVVMNAGRIEQIGMPQELYRNPRTRFVAGFIGSPAMNFLPCRIVENGMDLLVQLSDGLALAIPPERRASCRHCLGQDLLLGLRPEHITEARPGVGGAEFTVPVDIVEPMGMDTMVHFSVGGIDVCARCSPAAVLMPGQRMRLAANMRQMHLIDPKSNLVIRTAPEADAGTPMRVGPDT